MMDWYENPEIHADDYDELMTLIAELNEEEEAEAEG